MDEQVVRRSLINSQSHLSSYLADLNTVAKNQQVVVTSRWPSTGKIVTTYPGSIIDWMVLFFKTLHFDISKQARSQLIDRSISLLNIYKKAVEYELIATKPRTLFIEHHQLTKLDKWLQELLPQLPLESGFSEEQKEELRDWAGNLADRPTVIAPELFLKLKDMSSENQIKLISQFGEMIQARMEEIPHLINEAVKEAEIYYESNKPAGEEKGVVETGSRVDSLFNFFNNEEVPRPEMVAVYEQLDKAAAIWKQVSLKRTYQEEFQNELLEFHQFFKQIEQEHGGGRDIIAGIAYTQLFVDSEKPPTS